MSRQDSLILGVVWPMRKLPNVNQGGVLPRERVGQERRQRLINAKQEEPPVLGVKQARPLRVDDAKPEVRQQNNPNAVQGVARVISAGLEARLVANVKPGALRSLIPIFYFPW